VAAQDSVLDGANTRKEGGGEEGDQKEREEDKVP
jgi:hypothetical protein